MAPWKHHRRRGLRTWVLSMVARSPRNGAEIMDEIEGMSQGWWRPSPGSVYPLLDELSKDGLILKREDGKYEITARGREAAQWPFGMGTGMGQQPRGVEEVVGEIESYVSYLEDLAKTDRAPLDGVRNRVKNLESRIGALAE